MSRKSKAEKSATSNVTHVRDAERYESTPAGKADLYISSVATLADECLRLNAHGGLTQQQQTSFFLHGKSLTDQNQILILNYDRLVAHLQKTEGAVQVAASQANCAEASGACGKVSAAGPFPDTRLISDAVHSVAFAVDSVDSVIRSIQHESVRFGASP